MISFNAIKIKTTIWDYSSGEKKSSYKEKCNTVTNYVIENNR